jgi:hypothetical protein
MGAHRHRHADRFTRFNPPPLPILVGQTRLSVSEEDPQQRFAQLVLFWFLQQ